MAKINCIRQRQTSDAATLTAGDARKKTLSMSLTSDRISLRSRKSKV